MNQEDDHMSQRDDRMNQEDDRMSQRDDRMYQEDDRINQRDSRMNQANKGSDELSFRYESDASASFLVVTGIDSAAEYQCGMLGHNAVKGLIKPERVIKDGLICFYFNITSKVPLSVFIKRKKLSRPEFLKFVLDISSSINDSYGYLLNASNFILRQDYIYICPDTLEPWLIYVPAEGGTEDCEAFKSLVSELLLQHIHVKGFESENIVQRILSAVKNETFNLKYFVALISELLYGGKCRDDVNMISSVAADESAACFAGAEAALIGEKAAKASKAASSVGKAAVRPFTVFALFLQFIMAFLIYLCRGLIDSAGANHTANYAAILLIVLAIDVLVFNRILTSRMTKSLVIRREAPMLQVQKPEVPVPEPPKPKASTSEMPKSEMPKPEMLKPDMPNLEVPKPGAMRLANKTELLGRHAKGVRILKSAGKRAGEGDIVIEREDFIIGRLEGHVDHVLNNNAVGKLHAELINRNGTSFVKDLNSINGTFINDDRIDSNKEYELRINDRLRLANSEYIFTFDY